MAWPGRLRSFIAKGRSFLGSGRRTRAAIARSTQTTVDLGVEQWRRETLATNARHADSRALSRFEYRVYSQDGGDGILHEIFRRIGTTNRFFVEFGVSTGIENNSTFLLVQGWSGLWIEGSAVDVGVAMETFSQPIAAGRLKIREAFITAENIESLFVDAAVPAEPDLLSIDIDGNDYWIWKAIDGYRPRVVEVEYNASFPPDVSWVMTYNSRHASTGNSYFGASLKSLADLGTTKGYRLVACSLAGVNAFFVRDDLIDDDQFVGPGTAERFYEPPRYFLTNESNGHSRAFGDFEAV